MSNEKGLDIWNGILEGAMKLPIIRVNRVDFLTKELKHYVKDESKLADIANIRPEDIVNPAYLSKIANKVIRAYLTRVTTISAASGIPGGIALWGTIPADVAQYYAHVLSLTQKLAYIYGYGDFANTDEALTEEALSLLTLFVGVGFGSELAGQTINKISKETANKFAAKLASKSLTKSSIYQVVKKVASNIGIKITKGTFSRGVSKVIPIIGAATSGGLTYVTFRSMSNRINANMFDTMMDRIEIYESSK